MPDALYENLNVCRSFNQAVTTGTHKLSAQICGEVLIKNTGSNNVLIFDQNYADADNGFLLKPNEKETFHGLTNLDQVSAQGSGGASTIYYRAKYYSSNPFR